MSFVVHVGDGEDGIGNGTTFVEPSELQGKCARDNLELCAGVDRPCVMVLEGQGDGLEWLVSGFECDLLVASWGEQGDLFVLAPRFIDK